MEATLDLERTVMELIGAKNCDEIGLMDPFLPLIKNQLDSQNTRFNEVRHAPAYICHATPPRMTRGGRGRRRAQRCEGACA